MDVEVPMNTYLLLAVAGFVISQPNAPDARWKELHDNLVKAMS
jgi:hypothetical protein